MLGGHTPLDGCFAAASGRCLVWQVCYKALGLGCSGSQCSEEEADMGRRGELAVSLLVLALMAYICEAALLRRSSATDFLRSGRERRASRCMNGGCSSEDSEAEELLEANSDYEQDNSKAFFPGGSQVELLKAPLGETRQEGSGM
ncbi:hypothetical protein SRHO_G00269100 [Serrasalmus rhombeus]